MRKVIIGVGLAVIVVVAALLVAVIGHGWARWESPQTDGSLILAAGVYVYVSAQWILSMTRRKRRRRTR